MNSRKHSVSVVSIVFSNIYSLSYLYTTHSEILTTLLFILRKVSRHHKYLTPQKDANKIFLNRNPALLVHIILLKIPYEYNMVKLNKNRPSISVEEGIFFF